MSYVLNQFNQVKVDETSTSSSTNQAYLTPILNGTAARRQASTDEGVGAETSSLFYDECLKFTGSLTAGAHYYFHGKIKRLSSDQTFYIYLVNYEASTTDNQTQYIKTITVQGGLDTEWVDVEFIFTPIISFDCLLFQLQRAIEDYRSDVRYPVIVYEELDTINNIISSKIKSGVELLKIGVQSHPGLMMCINGEEIYVGRSGIYELRNGVILVNSFSVVKAAVENYNGTNPLKVDGKRATISEYLAYLASLETQTGTNTNSKCIFGNSKLRSIDPFTLDYMYSED